MTINDLKEAIAENRIKITDHADEEAVNDALGYEEIYYSVHHGEIIENYPKDFPFPSCLVIGRNFAEEPIHSVWAFNSKSLWAVLITVYRPDPERWDDWRRRKKE